MVCLGKPIARTDSFDSMKIIVETDRMHSIKGDIILTIEDLGFRIVVKEVGPAIQVIQKIQPRSTHPLEATDSNDGVLGFEDIEDEVLSGADMAINDRINEEVDLVHGEAQGTNAIQINSSVVEEKE